MGVLWLVVGFIVLEGGVDLTNGRAKMKLLRDILVVGCIQQINKLTVVIKQPFIY